jgi:hypothetical protein
MGGVEGLEDRGRAGQGRRRLPAQFTGEGIDYKRVTLEFVAGICAANPGLPTHPVRAQRNAVNPVARVQASGAAVDWFSGSRDRPQVDYGV